MAVFAVSLRMYPRGALTRPRDFRKSRDMKIRQIIHLALFSLMAGCGGYYVRMLCAEPTRYVSTKDWASLDYFFSAQSFSEIETARALLDALAARYLVGVDTQRALGIQAVRTGTGGPPQQLNLAETIRLLEEGIESFKGTEQEFHLTERLLLALEKEGSSNRWLDVYLDALYRHPTAGLVGEYARAAVSTGQATGRLEQVRKAFRHVCETPFDFAGKRDVQAANRDAGPLPWNPADSQANLLCLGEDECLRPDPLP